MVRGRLVPPQSLFYHSSTWEVWICYHLHIFTPQWIWNYLQISLLLFQADSPLKASHCIHDNFQILNTIALFSFSPPPSLGSGYTKVKSVLYICPTLFLPCLLSDIPLSPLQLLIPTLSSQFGDICCTPIALWILISFYGYLILVHIFSTKLEALVIYSSVTTAQNLVAQNSNDFTSSWFCRMAELS
jgi:hypothetical protein